MEAELLRLAQEAVTALQLQATGSPRWVEIAQLGISGGGLVISGAGLVAILVGLKRMGEAGQRRDREIDELAENMRESTRVVGQALERQGEVLAELLRRTA